MRVLIVMLSPPIPLPPFTEEPYGVSISKSRGKMDMGFMWNSLTTDAGIGIMPPVLEFAGMIKILFTEAAPWKYLQPRN
jgi:hypothetical protein